MVFDLLRGLSAMLFGNRSLSVVSAPEIGPRTAPGLAPPGVPNPDISSWRGRGGGTGIKGDGRIISSTLDFASRGDDIARFSSFPNAFCFFAARLR